MTDLDRSAPLMWRKSTTSIQGECVEVAFDEQAVAIRDSKDRCGPALVFSAHAWRTFLAKVKAGEIQPDGS